MGVAKFRTAASDGEDVIRLIRRQDDLAVLKLIIACANMIVRPSIEQREAVRELAAAVATFNSPLWRAYGRMAEARRILGTKKP